MCENRPRLSVVIPALNEAGRLPRSLRDIDAFLAAEPFLLPAEVIVVDDGSTDGTGDLVRAFVAQGRTKVRLLRHENNRGKGAAVRTGFAATSGAHVLLCDADLATPIEDVVPLLQRAENDAVVIGSRAVDRKMIAVPQPVYRDFMGRMFNLLVRALVVGGIADTQCGFKLFPGHLARALAAAQTIDGFAFDVEYLLLAGRWGHEVRETAVRWRHVDESRVLPGRHSLQMFRDLCRLCYRRLTGTVPTAPPEVGDAAPR